MKNCPNCGKEITKKRNKFCNSSCAAKYNNSRRKHSEETKAKIGNSVKKVYEDNPELREIQSNHAKRTNKNILDNPEFYEEVQRKNLKL